MKCGKVLCFQGVILYIISANIKCGIINIRSQNINVEEHYVFFHKCGRWKQMLNVEDKYTLSKVKCGKYYVFFHNVEG